MSYTKLPLSFFLFYLFSINLSTAQTFLDKSQLSPADQVVVLDKAYLRQELTAFSGEQEIALCGLEPGEDYLIAVNPFRGDDIELLINVSDQQLTKSFLEFTAEKACETFTLMLKADTPNSKHSIYFSAQRKYAVPLKTLSGPEFLPNISVDPSPTAQQLVDDVFIGGDCFEIANVIQLGLNSQLGSFSEGTSSISIEDGVIISTGNVTSATGPNVQGGTTGGGTGFGVDPDLTQLATSTLNDIAGIQFDFTPTVDQIEFNYVFASEEYCEFVNAGFNDVFGFFISGPGINGPFSNGAENIALVPGTLGTFVAIDNVNQGTNTQFFQSNDAGSCGIPAVAPNDLEYDGFTAVFTAVANVIPCETYTIRLVIADVGDAAYDSAVFLEANSFNAGGEAGVEITSPTSNDGTIYEDCQEGFITFQRENNSDISLPVTIDYIINPNSTATPGVDYNPLPTVITIPANQQSVTIPIDAFEDFIIEGQETIIIEVENSCNCSTASDTLYIEDLPEFTADMSDAQICEGESATLAPTFNGGVGNITYQWSNGSSGPTISVAPNSDQTYTVTMTDECGQTVTADATVDVLELPTATISGGGVICNNSPEVTIEVSFTGDGPWDFQYMWNGTPFPAVTGVTQNPYTFTVSQPGVYELLNVSNALCPGSTSGFVQVDISIMNLFAVEIDASCPEASNGFVNLLVTGGTEPITFQWDFGANSQDIGNLPPGTYEVTATDAFGCTEELTTEIEAGPELEAEAVIDQPVNCFNGSDGVLNVNVQNGSLPYEFTWSNGDDVQNPDSLGPGFYSVTIVDLFGCSDLDTISLTNPPEFSIEGTPGGIVDCSANNGGEITLEVTGGTPGYTYNWSNGDNTQNITGLGAGTYTVTVSDANNCNAFDTVEVVSTVAPPEVNTSGPDTITCSDPSLILDGSGSAEGDSISYSWTAFNGGNIISGNTTLNPEVDAAGTYVLTVLNNNNLCESTDTIFIAENTAIPIADAGVSQELNCIQTALQLDGSNSSTGAEFDYQWSTNNGNLVSGATTLTPTVDASGDYQLVVTNTTNGCTAQSTVNITIDQNPPVADAGTANELNCLVTDINLDGSNSSSGPDIDYQWSTNDGNIVSGPTTATPNVDAPGTYTLIITNTSNGCADTSQVAVSEDVADPVASAGTPQTITCDDPQLTLDGSASSNGPEFDYQWTASGGGNILNGDTTSNPIVDNAGQYTLVVTNTNNGCTAEASVTIDENITNPIADAGQPNQISCSTPSLTLDGTNSSSGPTIIYNWSTNDGNILSGGNTLNPVIDAPGTYEIAVIDSTNGCQDVAVVNISIDQSTPNALGGPDMQIDCNNATAVLDGSGSSVGPDFIYQWTTANGNILSGATTLTPEVDIDGTYILEVTNTANACVDSAEVVVVVDQTLPTADPGIVQTVNCFDSQITLGGPTMTTGPDISYQWTSTAGGNFVSSDTISNPVVDAGGDYTVVVSNNANGCTSEATVAIDFDQQVPNADAGATAELNCAFPTLSLDGTGSDTAPEIIYSWSTSDGNILSGDSTLLPEVDQPGSYELLVFNTQNGCSSTSSVAITQNNTVPTADAGVTAELDCTVSSLTLDGTGSSSGSTLVYTWTTPDGNILSGANTLSPEIDAAGVYTLEVADTANFCSSTSSVTITQSVDLPAAVANVNGLLTCDVLDLTLDGTGSETGASIDYTWSTMDGNIVSGTNTLTPVIDQPGTYNLLVEDNSNGCSSNTSVTVDQDIVAPLADAGPEDSLNCTILSVNLDGGNSSAGADFTYSWDTNDGNIVNGPNTINPEVDQPGIYNLVVEDQTNGCTSTDQVTVVQDIDLPLADAGQEDTLTCAVTQLQLGATASQGADFQYQWTASNGGNIVADATTLTPTVDEPGLYTLTVINTDNTCASTAVVEIAEDVIAPTAVAGPTAVLTCVDTLLNLDGTSSSSGAIFTADWSTTDGNLVNGGNTLTPEINAPGTYNLLITNIDNGCTAQADVTITQDIAPPIADAGPTAEINCTQTSLVLDGSASSAGANIDYEWMTPDGSILSGTTTTSPEVDAAGTYELIVTNTINGCTSIDQVVITEDVNLPNTDAGIDTTLTCAITSLVLDGTNSTASPNLTYNWTTNDGNIVSGVNGLLPEVDAPGTYTLNVLDTTNNCSVSSSVLVDIDTLQPDLIIQPTSMLTCDVTSVIIDATSSSSGPEFIPQWTAVLGAIASGETTLTPTIEEPGLYSLTIIDQSNGCSITSSVGVPQDIDPPFADAGSTSTLNCAVTSIALDGTNSSSGNEFEYSWTTNNGNILSGDDQPSPQIDEPGTYNLVVTDNTNGCTSTSEVMIDQDIEVPQLQLNSPALLTCDTVQTELSVLINSSNANFNLTWTTLDGNIIGPNSNAMIELDQPGFYQVEVLDLQNFCLDSIGIQVDQDIEAPEANAGLPATITCGDPSLTLDGTNSSQGSEFTYTWTTGNGNIVSGATTLNPVIDQAGNYELVVTDNQNGCTSLADVNIDEDTELPVVDAGEDDILNCIVSELNLDGTGSSTGNEFEYTWTTSNGNIISGASGLAPQIDAPGTYTLTIINTDNECEATDEVEIDQDVELPNPEIEFTGINQLDCNNNSLVLDGSSSTPAAVLSFDWSTANGNIISGTKSSFITLDEPGVYELTVTNNVNGCTQTVDLGVNQDITLPNVVINDPDILTCLVTEIGLDATGSSVGTEFEYDWSTGPGGNILTGQSTLNPLVDEAATYTLTVLDTTNGCESEASIEVDEDVVLPTVVTSVNEELNCVIEEVDISGQGSSSGPIFTYNWTTTTGSIISGQNAIGALVNEPGVYTLQVTNNQNGCTNTADLIVEENTDVPTGLTLEVEEPLCFGDRGRVFIQGTEGGSPPYVYSINGGESFFNVTGFNTLDPGNYNIIVQDVIGCEYEQTFAIPQPPEISIEMDAEVTVKLGESTAFLAQVNIPEEEIAEISWTPMDFLSCTDCLNPQVELPDFPMTYTITVESDKGCIAEDRISLRIQKDRDVFIPNAFTPFSSPGDNDEFMIFANENQVVKINTFQVFNRWGEKVFEANNFQPNDPAFSWNGEFKGDQLNPGVFVYFAEIEFVDGEVILYKGDVTLVE